MSVYKLDVEDTPYYYILLKRVFSSIPKIEIENDAGFRQITIPKGLTLNKVVKVCSLFTINFRHIDDSIIKKIGDVPVDNTYRIIITNNVTKDSRNLSLSNQKGLLKTKSCEMPTILEACVFFVTEYLTNGNLCAVTRCSEQIDDHPVIVGGVSEDNFITVCCSDHVDDDIGAFGVLRKF